MLDIAGNSSSSSSSKRSNSYSSYLQDVNVMRWIIPVRIFTTLVLAIFFGVVYLLPFTQATRSRGINFLFDFFLCLRGFFRCGKFNNCHETIIIKNIFQIVVAKAFCGLGRREKLYHLDLSSYESNQDQIKMDDCILCASALISLVAKKCILHPR